MSASIRKLAIVGASARAATFSAIDASYEVEAADLFADADLQRVATATRIGRYPDGLAEWLAATECDAWIYTGALENYAELVDRMAATRPLLGNNGHSLRRVRDPFNLQQILRATGLRIPETRKTAGALPMNGSWLCKTYRGSSGSGVYRLDGDASLRRAQRDKAVFQRYVPGEAAAAVFIIAARSARLLGVTHQFVGSQGPRAWQYVGSIGPIQLGASLEAQLATLGKLLAQEFQLRGLVGVDLVIDGDKLWVIEVNPRFTASIEILERASGQSAVAAHVAACASKERRAGRGQATPIPWEFKTKFHAKSIVFARRTVQISASFSRWAMSESTSERSLFALADIPRAGEIIPSGRPILTVFAAAGSINDCESLLAERVSEIESKLFERIIQRQT